jgi:hypothetical protein
VFAFICWLTTAQQAVLATGENFRKRAFDKGWLSGWAGLTGVVQAW